ncbi:DNA-binding protein [Desulfogranum japonicum]|uniref:DNA-binding protein n=1 Tax=Desulfogranum japonicum TaxID=231447 RepID=UPI0004103881|nr:DNA-binding protein [Desulfogranum japonicum]
MQQKILIFAVLTLLCFSFTASALAQQGMNWKGSGGWGAQAPYARMYNPQSVETVNGEVVSIEKIIPMQGMNYGMHLTLQTETETISVHLGPAWYLENQDVQIAAADKIEIKGSRVTLDGKPVLIAAELKKGDKVLVLRDAGGFPVWSGWRRR